MFDPKEWLRLAAEKVPVLWYAVGVAGIIVAVAIIHKLVPDLRLETLLMVVVGATGCMVLLIIVSWIGRTPGEGRRPVATIFLWSVCLLAVTLMFFTFTAFVFEWPSRWAEVVAPRAGAARV